MTATVQTGPAAHAQADILDFQLRAGTQDQAVFDDVIVNNQYRLPDTLDKDSIIIDIGANVGAFAVACLLRGAGTVVCFEPCPYNYRQLLKNVSPWTGQVAPFKAAVWRSDKNEKLEFIGDHRSTACGGVAAIGNKYTGGDFRVQIESMGLDDILFHVTDGGQRKVDILKIDAEGSEYPILYTARHLESVQKLIVETHQCDTIWPSDDIRIAGYPLEEACASGMQKFLVSKGFAVESQAESRQNQICTLLFATRTPEKT